MIAALVPARPAHGCRRIAPLLNRPLRCEHMAPVSHKRFHRIMQAHNLLLPADAPDGRS